MRTRFLEVHTANTEGGDVVAETEGSHELRPLQHCPKACVRCKLLRLTNLSHQGSSGDHRHCRRCRQCPAHDWKEGGDGTVGHIACSGLCCGGRQIKVGPVVNSMYNAIAEAQ